MDKNEGRKMFKEVTDIFFQHSSLMNIVVLIDFLICISLAVFVVILGRTHHGRHGEDSPEWVSIEKQIPISVQIISRVSKKRNKKKNIIFLKAPISNYRIDNRSRPCEIGE